MQAARHDPGPSTLKPCLGCVLSSSVTAGFSCSSLYGHINLLLLTTVMQATIYWKPTWQDREQICMELLTGQSWQCRWFCCCTSQTIWSLSEKGLQSQLNALHAFCENGGLTVNLAKTKAVVFNQRTYKDSLVFAGRTVEQVDRYKYLGLVMHQNGSFTCAIESLKSAAQRALFALQARCAELGIMDVQLRCRLNDAVVKPVLSYGCEVWMPLVSESSLKELERVHLSFLRGLLDVPRMASAKHMYAETGRLPHRIFWWQQSIKYLHHLTSLNPTKLIHRAFTAYCIQELGWGAGCAYLRPP